MADVMKTIDSGDEDNRQSFARDAAFGIPAFDSAGNAALERIEDELDLQAWEVAKAAFDADSETISAADIALKYL